MATIAQVARRFKKLQRGLPKRTSDIISETATKIVQLQKEQLYSGELSTGADIEPEYSEFTVEQKLLRRSPTQPVDRVTLKDEGAFYGGIRVKSITRKSYTITSLDVKTKSLEGKYSPQIFGLNDTKKEEYIDKYFFPLLKAYIEGTVQIKMT